MHGQRSTKMSTSIERVFRKNPDGLCREILMHYIHFLSEDGKVISSKLDKQINGRLYKRATLNERSSYGEVEYQFPDEDKPVRLIALGVDYADQRYGRR